MLRQREHSPGDAVKVQAMGSHPTLGSQGSFPGGGAVCIESMKDALSQPGKGGAGLQVVSQQREKYM